jgi:hypothetical protein
MRSFGIFKEIERLIEYIPIESEYYAGSLNSNNNNSGIDNAKFAKGALIDSKFYFDDIDGVATRLGIIEVVKRRNRKTNSDNSIFNEYVEDNNYYYYATVVSFRDIVKLFNKFLKDANIEELVTKQRYRCLTRQIQGL